MREPPATVPRATVDRPLGESTALLIDACRNVRGLEAAR